MTATDRVMIDIETLGTEPGCTILSIAAVQFNRNGLGDTFRRSINMRSCQEAGLEIDAETLDWWLHQGDEAREEMTGGDDLGKVLGEFAMWYDADEVWANSPSFDCAILEAAFQARDITVPWHFSETRDFRTLKNLPVDVDVTHDGVDHNALDDAVYQAEVAIAVLRELEGYDG